MNEMTQDSKHSYWNQEDNESVPRCPQCGSNSIRVYVAGRTYLGNKMDDDYCQCWDCNHIDVGHRFELN